MTRFRIVTIAGTMWLAGSLALFAQSDRRRESGRPSRPASSEKHSSEQREARPARSEQRSEPRSEPRSESQPARVQRESAPGRRYGNQGGSPGSNPNPPVQRPSSSEQSNPNRVGGNVSQPNSSGGYNRQPSGVSPRQVEPPRQSGSDSNNRRGDRQGGSVYRPQSTPSGENRGGERQGGSVYQPQSTPSENRPNSGGGFGGTRPSNNNGGVYQGGGQRYGSGTQVVRSHNGGTVYRNSGGSVREVRTPGGAVIHYAPGGYKRVEMSRPGGHVVVATSRGNIGYVQRPLVYQNRSYIQRTYVRHNVSYTRVYRPYLYRGITFHVYTPVRYYSPGFYAWAYNPWARPVYYSWGWSGRPWYGYYGGYFSPYPYYLSPTLWLTDYLIARTLEDAYQERMEAAAAQVNYEYGGATSLTPEVKQQIADEVHRQLEWERAERETSNIAANEAPPIYSANGPRIFVVSDPLEVSDGGQGCPLSEGDVLQLSGPPSSTAMDAEVVVLASKGRDCRKGSRVLVQVQDLQEMQNQMRATIDSGLSDLQSRQGQDGLPPLPASATGTREAPFAAQVRADSNAAAELSRAAQEAGRAEQDTLTQAENVEPIRISLGQTVQDVEATLGRPREIFDLGAKKVYVYQSTKITFVNGKVADVQ